MMGYWGGTITGVMGYWGGTTTGVMDWVGRNNYWGDGLGGEEQLLG